MTDLLYWLCLAVLVNALMWLPYILDRVAVRGFADALANPSPGEKPQSPWAQRAMAAHRNATENLVVFAPAALVAHLVGADGPAVVTAAMIYVIARVAHYVIYLMGIIVLRTLVFAVGWLATVYVILAAMGVV